ncbi:TIGR03086 family metal-binding protein [Nocardioides sp.]|uniref:TIGR03086 family metal-binding protein n=1 Tax=Nocardioides sp. TaxID=35761 RepID=UPI0031FECE33|nr:hypothetical protein [Nocardioides sp.]
MTEANESVVLLSRALDQAGDVLTAIREDQLTLPTPCGDWDVARLIAHVVATPANFVTLSTGGEVDWAAEPAPAGHDYAARFRSGADDLIHFWHQAGDSARPEQLSWQLAELAVHTWDLARATGQTPQLDPEVAERGLAFMSASLTPENRGDAFGAEVQVPEDAPAYDRIAAFAGRDPS